MNEDMTLMVFRTIVRCGVDTLLSLSNKYPLNLEGSDAAVLSVYEHLRNGACSLAGVACEHLQDALDGMLLEWICCCGGGGGGGGGGGDASGVVPGDGQGNIATVLAMDVWLWLAQHLPAPALFSQAQGLVEFLLTLDPESAAFCNCSALTSGLLTLMTKEHRMALFKRFDPGADDSHFDVFSLIPLSCFFDSQAQSEAMRAITRALTIVRGDMEVSERVMAAFRFLCNLFRSFSKVTSCQAVLEVYQNILKWLQHTSLTTDLAGVLLATCAASLPHVDLGQRTQLTGAASKAITRGGGNIAEFYDQICALITAAGTVVLSTSSQRDVSWTLKRIGIYVC